MLPYDREALAQLLCDAAPEHMVEIGVNQGFTTYFLLKNVPSIKKYTGIEVEYGYQLEIPAHTAYVTDGPGNLAADDPRFKLIIRPRGSLDLTPEDIGECDAIFIDGDHGTNTVMHDTELALACVRPGGIILWHDATLYGVPEVLDLFGDSVKHVRGTNVAYMRI